MFYLNALLFHLIIIFTLGFNHSDSIFLLLFYNGTLIFILGYYFKKNYLLYNFGLLLVGISILFRHQGLIFLVCLCIFFLMFESWQCKKKISLFIREYIKIFIVLSIPFILSQIHLSLIEASTEWQTRFKLHFFIHGDLWGDWRD